MSCKWGLAGFARPHNAAVQITRVVEAADELPMLPRSSVAADRIKLALDVLVVLEQRVRRGRRVRVADRRKLRQVQRHVDRPACLFAAHYLLARSFPRAAQRRS